MHGCPHCNQELTTFAFYCPRCNKLVGIVEVDGVMLALTWLDASGRPVKKFALKTLKQGPSYLNVKTVSPQYPTNKTTEVVFTLADGRQLRQNLLEFFAAVLDPSQEWNIG
jgi:hypothetical protein